MNFVFVLTIVLIAIELSNGAEKEKCTITEEEAEKCGSKMFLIGSEGFVMPKTDEDIATNCKSIEEGIDCFKNYAKNCLDSFSSRVMGMIGRNGKRMADKICKAVETRNEFLNHLNCWKDAEAMAPVHLCMDKYVVQMESLSDVEGDNRIPATCCSYHMLKECMKREGTKSCDKTESVAYIDNISTGVTGDLIKFVCGKFTSLEDCNTKMDPAAWQHLKDLVASDDPQVIKGMKKFPTAFGALKEMLKKIKN